MSEPTPRPSEASAHEAAPQAGEAPAKTQAAATRAELAAGARRHYDRLSREACDWSSTIPHAIDAWEREPAIRAEARRAAMEEAARIADAEAESNERSAALARAKGRENVASHRESAATTARWIARHIRAAALPPEAVAADATPHDVNDGAGGAPSAREER